MKKIPEVLEKIYENPSLRKKAIPLFLGNPGIGKTKLIEDFARKKGVNLVEVIASQLLPNEISGIAIPCKETNTMTYFDYDRFINMKDGDILFFDELPNANTMVLNACLTLLENRRMISGRKLNDIMIIAAGNPQGSQVMTPQIKERFIWYNVEVDKEMWKKYMVEKYQITHDVYEGLWTLIKSEKFAGSEKNYNTPRSLDKAVEMLINEVPTPYEKFVKPVLSVMVKNDSGNDLPLNDKGDVFKNNEMMTWLEIAIKRNKK